MSVRHLAESELDAVLCGEDLTAEQQDHLAACVACRRRRDGFLRAVTGAAEHDPDAPRRAVVRAAALAQWHESAPSRHWYRLALGLAAVVVLGLLPVLRRHEAPVAAVNPDVVLVEVDRVLARDPLAALASEDVVDELAPLGRDAGEGSAS